MVGGWPGWEWSLARSPAAGAVEGGEDKVGALWQRRGQKYNRGVVAVAGARRSEREAAVAYVRAARRREPSTRTEEEGDIFTEQKEIFSHLKWLDLGGIWLGSSTSGLLLGRPAWRPEAAFFSPLVPAQ